jgi:hypothetical protein
MPMTMASSIIDGSIAAAGVIGVLMAFVAALKAVEGPIMSDARGGVEPTPATLKRVA